MLTKRIIPCLDIRNRKVTKGVQFKNNVDLGDPVEMAANYYEDGCDELVFYDITASSENRPIDIEMVREVARAVRIPFSVGGGIWVHGVGAIHHWFESLPSMLGLPMTLLFGVALGALLSPVFHLTSKLLGKLRPGSGS